MEKDWVILKIDDRRMWASLTIKKPEGEENSYFSPDFIENYLKENGIKTGILRENIETLADSLAYGVEMIVAKGKEPVNGRDGSYSFTVTLEDLKNKPTINKDGSVDYYNSLKLAMVEENAVFAVYNPATSGEYGYTIFSEMLPPVRGKELRPLKGRGFAVSEDKNTYTALYKGRIYKQGDSIIIDKVYVVKGDLDITQGNIKFNGDVEIKGDVRSGLVIETDGDIFVHGHVGGCRLVAGGNITIQHGIQGRDKCTIIAGKDVACSFVERCSIVAGGNVYADSILDSEVLAKQKVIVSSRKGLILGAEVTGVQGITAKTAGNDTGIITTLSAGVTKDDLIKLSELSEKLAALKANIIKLEKHQKAIDTLDGSKITKEIEAMRVKIIRAKVVVSAEHKALMEQYNLLEESINTARREACIHITGVAYGDLRVNIGHASCVTREAIKDVIFKNVNEQIVTVAGSEE